MIVLGLITARAGSKGIPHKNVRPLGGRPLIVYTIEAARGAKLLDRVVLSTDDPVAAGIARDLGCEVPFTRPAELAQDDTPHLPVVQHAVNWLASEQGYRPDAILILQPTSPFRRPEQIDAAIRLMKEKGADSVVGVSEVPAHLHPTRMLSIDEQGFARLLMSGEPVRKRVTGRKRLTRVWLINGAIYLVRTEALYDPHEPNLFGDRVRIYVMDSDTGMNIDEPEDWDVAERSLAARNLMAAGS
jgi:CMP-N,N'-diacetyllegionaminic acid synthase